MSEIKPNIIARYNLIILAFVLLGVSVVIKAGVIMFIQKDYWEAVADRFTKENVPIMPNRGNILSADGKLMASSLPEYRIYMDFKAGGAVKDSLLMEHLNEICEGLHRILPDKSVAEYKSTILRGRKQQSQNFLLYPKRISYIKYKEIKQLPVFNMNKYRGGFHNQAYNNRKKPFGSLASQTLGSVYADASLGAKNGIELAFDSLLKGKEGITRRQKVRNKYLNIIETPAEDGCDLVTTIDVDMQDICEKALIDKLREINGHVGVVVLMEVETGEVKAVVNMMKGKDGNYYEMDSNAISDMLEPGSTFKTASIMVALEDGYITPDTEVDTGNGIRQMYGSKMRDHNWHRGGYGTIDVTQIMMYSSNVGVSHLIDKYYSKNPQKYVDGLKRMSLDQPLNLQIMGEGKPNIKGPNERYFSKTTLPWMSIGYETQVPPLNILTFYNAIANNGVMVKPKFVKEVIRDGRVVEEIKTEVINPKICSESTLKQIQEMLYRVVHDGLAKPAGSKQFDVAGKTGTAQISQGAAGYKSGTVNYLVSFAGYFPAEKPKYSCIVSIRKPGLPASGGLMAGAVFGKIAERVYAKNLFLPLANAVDTVSNRMHTPKVKAGETAETRRVLSELKIKTEVASAGSRNRESWSRSTQTDDAVQLEQIEVSPELVPNVVGMGARDAVYLLESRGMVVRVSGVGKVHRQSVQHSTKVRKGQQITLSLN